MKTRKIEVYKTDENETRIKIMTVSQWIDSLSDDEQMRLAEGDESLDESIERYNSNQRCKSAVFRAREILA